MPIRVTQNGEDLCGPVSPILRHQIPICKTLDYDLLSAGVGGSGAGAIGGFGSGNGIYSSGVGSGSAIIGGGSSNSNSSTMHQHLSMNSVDAVDSSLLRVGAIKKVFGKLTSMYNINRKRYTDQEKAFFIVICFMIGTVGVATIVHFFMS